MLVKLAYPIKIRRVPPRRPKLGGEHSVESFLGLRIGQPIPKETLCLNAAFKSIGTIIRCLWQLESVL